MESSVVIAGFGGQGVILAGKILAQAGMDSGLEVTWLPSYGPEMRGGTANCTVVLSDAPVGSPIVDEPTAVIAMNLPSLEKFESVVAKGGVLIVNRSLIERPVRRTDLASFALPINDLALRAGNARTGNMVALGAYARATGIVSLERIKAAMAAALQSSGKDKLIAVNEKALEEGFAAAS
ncbi:MAG: 2-oxoacid:acceptor oxidoreductase family protein [Candidatus Bipolaricaulota bacterium]